MANAWNQSNCSFQCAEESFDAAVALRLTDEGWGRFHSEEPDLVLEIFTHVDAAVIVAKPHSGGDAGGEVPNCSVMACPIGSSGSNRCPRLTAWMPRHSAVHWSMAAEDCYLTVVRVKVAVASVPHNSLGALTTMVPACAFQLWAPADGSATVAGAHA